MPESRVFQPNWSVLRVAGPDAAGFLHNLCTNEVNKLSAGQSCEALFTNVKGKVLAHTILCREETGIAIVITSPDAEQLAQHLDKYHIREDLTISVQNEQRPTLCWGMTGGFELAALDATLHPSSAELELPAALIDNAAFDRLRIERRFPLDGIDIDERNLPQELGRDAALISFTKGCYLGQETVARIDALGRVNQQLAKLHSAEAVNVNDELCADGKPVGRITSVAAAETNGYDMLGYVRREHLASGTTLQHDGGEAQVV